jgi:hypothetical protein
MSKKKKTTFKASFKIKDRLTGLYRTNDGGWNTRGKTWETIGYLKLHLKNYNYNDLSKIPINWEIIVMIEVPETYIPVSGIECMKQDDIILTAIGQANFAKTQQQKTTE